jgi:putative hydrolase of the HAD superfamily
VTRAILFDLDDTLVVEEPAAVAAFSATAAWAAARAEVEPVRLARDARARARELWYAAPTHPFCKSVGISSWEGLWCRYEGDGEDLRALRAWAPEYRREAWRLALADQGVDDAELAAALGERFGVERRMRHETFDDAAPTLDALRDGHAFVLVTNGASCLQREKLAASGLADRFDAVVVSGDLVTAKPDPVVFAHALQAVGCEPHEAVMVGDNLANDVGGALAAGLGAVWLNRDGRERPADRTDLCEIAGLEELPAVLA